MTIDSDIRLSELLTELVMSHGKKMAYVILRSLKLLDVMNMEFVMADL